jgi:hypothetical protein
MATVYLARDLKLARTVALKVLRPEVAQVLGEARFKQEIELAAPLTHPNILPFIDSDQAAGRLFYVMPYVEGGTLADRLAHGPRPALPEAIEITRQIASGLAYAHALGVVHRDIKPGNILLATGHAWIADFGIARMIRQAISDTAERPADDPGRLTETGLVVGTAEYMAPEQHRASTVDGRADEYSLACVLFEMLTGKLPSSAAVRPGGVRQELRAAGVHAPPAVEQTLERALAIDLEERFPSVGEFAEALVGAVEPARIRSRRSSLRGAMAAAAAVLGIALWLQRPRATACPVPHSDTTGYAVFPFVYQPGVSPIGEEQLMADALARWSGLRVVDQFQLREVVGRLGPGELRLESAREVACKLGVRRLVLGNVMRVPNRDSIRVSARIYDLGPRPAPLAGGASVRLPDSLGRADSLFAVLADSLLFRGHPPPSGPGPDATRSLPARQAFDSGQRALASWDLAAADSAFHTAVALDSDYASAQLWLALVRAWDGREPALWLGAAERAAHRLADYSRPGDSLLAAAIVATGHGDLGRACPMWRVLTRVDGRRFASWYGLSECLRRDSIVLPDRNSRTGWRFRSSYQEAQRAYLNAIRLLPSILGSPRNRVADQSEGLLFTTELRRRRGRALPPDTTSFLAAADWAGDSLAFVPVPSTDPKQMKEPLALRPEEAVRRQRLLLDTLAITWVTADPKSIEARLALVEAMALAGDPSAVDSARAARLLARDSASLVRAVDAEIRTLLQFSLPDRVGDLKVARALADSILDRPRLRAAAGAATLTGLAALTGRTRLAANSARQESGLPWDAPRSLIEASRGLLIFSAMGGPEDSVRSLWRLTREAIEQALPPALRLERAMVDLGRPATLVFPAETLPSLFALRGKGDWLLTLQADVAAGKPLALARWTDSPVATRLATGDWTFDTALPVAALFAAQGDTTRAMQTLDASLATIRYRPYASFGDPVEVATMVRAMALRADLAERLGQSATGRQWATAVTILWADADEFNQPLVQRMQRMLPGHTDAERRATPTRR